jgi:hypothetical protein
MHFGATIPVSIWQCQAISLLIWLWDQFAVTLLQKPMVTKKQKES